MLIVGAGGFIGGFIAQKSLSRGYDTYVAVRESTARTYLVDQRLKYVVLDYDNTEDMASRLKECAPASGRWDYIIYNLGATKCANFADFNRINYLYLRNFVEILRDNGMLPERFLFMSSLSALGPGDEKGYAPLDNHSVPNPNTRYGLSKIKAETFLRTVEGLDYIIFRPTGVYGPHEKDYLMMIKSIDSHWDFGVGFKKQMLTFIYVEDLVDAMMDAISAGVSRKTYIISEPRSYTQSEFRKIVARELDKKFVIPVKLPMWLVYMASFVAEKWGVMKMQPSTLNRDKYKIMKQRNWNADISDAVRDFGFSPKYSLEEGIRQTVKSYLGSKGNK
ncbi:MAG: NAD(P)-dependent oxidoreductase [Muribaculaceae bacterium]|nr:NAD(P)-dependent oxidoreductase [Muribaculaceae bacterium]